MKKKKIKKLAHFYRNALLNVYIALCQPNLSNISKQLAIWLQLKLWSASPDVAMTFTRKQFKEMAGTSFDDTLLDAVKEIQACRMFKIEVRPESFVVSRR